jgi:hypothetical protein
MAQKQDLDLLLPLGAAPSVASSSSRLSDQ